MHIQLVVTESDGAQIMGQECNKETLCSLTITESRMQPSGNFPVTEEYSALLFLLVEFQPLHQALPGVCFFNNNFLSSFGMFLSENLNAMRGEKVLQDLTLKLMRNYLTEPQDHTEKYFFQKFVEKSSK